MSSSGVSHPPTVEKSRRLACLPCVLPASPALFLSLCVYVSLSLSLTHTHTHTLPPSESKHHRSLHCYLNRRNTDYCTCVECALHFNNLSTTLTKNTLLILPLLKTCLLYTSDAADEEDSVDLGGRRIIKKKKKNIEREYELIDERRNVGRINQITTLIL
eukprot:TRINITY_DN13134_c0_g1_i13.p1 TRINITY_DN13134_c0_g1~~TRINITY_DN13134_c0_g1_i13.p1  ORF type:complete len:160 (-),score=7.52 TRINITY_DN13134_c0_g1_i13:3-482(-)